MRALPTVRAILEGFVEDARSESTATLYSLLPDADGAWFVREQPFGRGGASWQIEQYMIAAIIQIVRIGAGPDWVPDEIWVGATDKIKPLPYPWRQVKINWGSEVTAIRIPARVLGLDVKPAQLPITDSCTEDRDTGTKLDFAELVRTQLLSHRPGLELAANQVGMSPATLKRRLAVTGYSYSEFVELQRFALARDLLVQTEMPVHAISEKLGYQHAANFTRAFKRMSALTPDQYRRGGQARYLIPPASSW